MLSFKAVQGQPNGQPSHDRQHNRGDDAVSGLLLFNCMDPVAERLVDVLNLLGEAGEGLQFAGDGGYQLGIDALANRAVLLEGGLAVEARVPDQEYRLSAFEVDWHRTGVEDRERQLTAIARINMKPGYVDQTTELGLRSNGDEGQRIRWDGDNLLGEQEGELGLIRFGGHLPKGEYDVDHGDTKGRRGRRSFTDDYKTGAVRLVLDEGKTVASAARDLGLTESSLRNWVEQTRADRTKGKIGLTTAEREELARLRKEVRELRMERYTRRPKKLSDGWHRFL